MMRRGGQGDGSPSIESLHELRLRALLHDLVNDLGPGRAAEQFGVDRKTLWRWQRAVELPPAWPRRWSECCWSGVSAAGQDRERVRGVGGAGGRAGAAVGAGVGRQQRQRRGRGQRGDRRAPAGVHPGDTAVGAAAGSPAGRCAGGGVKRF